MAKMTLELKVHVAWWVKPYLHTVSFFAWMTGLQPDAGKVSDFAMKGVTVKGPR